MTFPPLTQRGGGLAREPGRPIYQALGPKLASAVPNGRVGVSRRLLRIKNDISALRQLKFNGSDVLREDTF